jgi:hypothetical protein
MRLGHVGRLSRSVLVKTIPVPSILEKILLVGWGVFAPTAITIGIGLVPTDPIPAFYWFGAAAVSTMIAVFLWDEVLKLRGGWRIVVSSIAVLIVLFFVWRGDNWIVRTVSGNYSMLEAQDEVESKAAAAKAKPIVLTKFILPLPPEGHKTEDGVIATVQRSLQVADRPYVFALDVQFIDDNQKVQIRYQNGGKSPAIGLGLTAHYGIASKNIDLEQIVAQELDPPSGSSGNVPAGGIIVNELNTGKLSAPDMFSAAKKDEETFKIYVVGFLTYSDLDNFTYQPRFCFVWSPNDNNFVQCPMNSFVKGENIEGQKP